VQHPDDPPVPRGQPPREGGLVVGGVGCPRRGAGGAVAAQRALPGRVGDHGSHLHERNRAGAVAARSGAAVTCGDSGDLGAWPGQLVRRGSVLGREAGPVGGTAGPVSVRAGVVIGVEGPVFPAAPLWAGLGVCGVGPAVGARRARAAWRARRRIWWARPGMAGGRGRVRRVKGSACSPCSTSRAAA
jgi:hypothetical protein